MSSFKIGLHMLVTYTLVAGSAIGMILVDFMLAPWLFSQNDWLLVSLGALSLFTSLPMWVVIGFVLLIETKHLTQEIKDHEK